MTVIVVGLTTVSLLSLCFIALIDASTYVLKPPKNPSKESKWVAEGEKPTAMTNALDAEHRFAAVGGTIVEVAWSESIRNFAQIHFEKLEQGDRMWIVLFVTTHNVCYHCSPAILQYEAAAHEFKDFVDFGAVSIFEQADVADWFKEKYGLVVDRVPMVQIFRPAVDRVAGKFEMLYYSLKIERDILIGTLTQMMPSRIAYPLPPAEEQTCLVGIDVLRYWLSLDKPTLLALPLKTKSPPAFLRSISEDANGVIAVHQITEELPPVCDFVLKSALRIKRRPALVLVRPLKSFQAGNVAHIDHFRIPSDDTMSNGAFRRWLDRAWKKIGMQDELGPLRSRHLIPKYVEPEVLRAILTAELEADREEKYNEEVDRAADEKEEREKTAEAKAATSPTKSEYNYEEQEAVEEEKIDFRDEL